MSRKVRSASILVLALSVLIVGVAVAAYLFTAAGAGSVHTKAGLDVYISDVRVTSETDADCSVTSFDTDSWVFAVNDAYDGSAVCSFTVDLTNDSDRQVYSDAGTYTADAGIGVSGLAAISIMPANVGSIDYTVSVTALGEGATGAIAISIDVDDIP